MQEVKKTKIRKVAILALFLLLVLVIGATYAYFAAQKGVGGSANIEVGAGTTDSLTFYNEDSEIIIVANQDNFGKNNETLTKQATVKAKLVPNNNTNVAHEKYNIFLVIENNDLEYTKNSSTPELLLKITDPEEHEYLQNVEGLKYYDSVTDKNSASFKGYDITESTNQVYKIVSDYEIDAQDEPEEHTWQIEVDLINLDQDQNNNTGKTFEGSIYITSESDYKLNEVNTLDTTYAENSITASADVNAGTSEIATYYFAIEKTSETPEDTKISSLASALAKTYVEETETNIHTFNEDIEENQNYKIYTYAVDKKGYKSNIYETVVNASEGDLPKVANITTSSTFNSVTFNFPTEGSLQYRLKLDNGEWTSYINETSHTFRGLVLGSTHKVYIQAKNANEKVSNIMMMTVATSEYTNPSVTNIDISDITYSGFTAKATVEAGSEDIAKVEFKVDEEDQWYSGSKNEDGTYSYTFTGLKETTEYTVTAKATSSGLGGEGQFNTTATTGEGPKENLANFIIAKTGTSVGNGTLAQHTPSVTDSAGDNSYRYSGSNPYNYVCFGNGSEEYNNGGKACPDTNLYRIIGVFNNQVKLIKSEYILSSELGIASKNAPSVGSYENLKRVQKNPTDGFVWNSVEDNTWETSSLKAALNKEYLTWLGETWAAKIAPTIWYAGGINSPAKTPKGIYEAEFSSTPTQPAQVGLMYVSDYGFASSSSSWQTTLENYDTEVNRGNNWLFNNVYEWTITPNVTEPGVVGGNVFDIYNTGYVRSGNYVFYDSYGVRPTFYLNNEVLVKSDNSLGSVTSPFRIVV